MNEKSVYFYIEFKCNQRYNAICTAPYLATLYLTAILRVLSVYTAHAPIQIL